jgi:hypothetical protein
MSNERKSNGYWKIKENCKNAALDCKTLIEFYNKYRIAYNNCIKNNWLDELCLHIIRKIKPKNYWNKDKCKEVALKCSSLKEFRKTYPSAYDISLKNNWICEYTIYEKILKRKY